MFKGTLSQSPSRAVSCTLCPLSLALSRFKSRPLPLAPPLHCSYNNLQQDFRLLLPFDMMMSAPTIMRRQSVSPPGRHSGCSWQTVPRQRWLSTATATPSACHYGITYIGGKATRARSALSCPFDSHAAIDAIPQRDIERAVILPRACKRPTQPTPS